MHDSPQIYTMASTNDITEEDKVADALKHSWVYRLPKWIWPYAQLARWERPIGWQLLMWPCWWSFMLAMDLVNSRTPSGAESIFVHNTNLVLIYLALFALGAFLMRGAGCTYNDLVDIDIDNKVARTRSRPLPSGRASKKAALAFLLVQCFAGLFVLIAISTLQSFTFWLGVASIITVTIYPFMKRITWWPQLFLGFAFSWGALMGWSAIFGEISIISFLLYIGSICWVIGYDTIYAHQDIEDDAIIGVKSTAILFGDKTKIAIFLLYGTALMLFAVAFYLTGVGVLAWIGFIIACGHIGWQIKSLDISSPQKCLQLFKSNNNLGWILFAGLTVSALLKAF